MAKKSGKAEDFDAGQNTPAEQEGKGRRTPSRRESQALKAQPLVGSRDRAIRKQQRARMQESRERARVGMMRGDDRYLTPRDKGPQRRYVRDFVDARLSIGEWLIPLMIILLLVMFFPGPLQVYGVAIVWGFVVFAIIDAFILGAQLKKRLNSKFGESNVQKGYRWYGAMRALQFRMLRMPKPQVKRFHYPE